MLDDDVELMEKRKDVESISLSDSVLSKSLHMSYIRYRYFLYERGIEAAAISLNLPDTSSSLMKNAPTLYWSEKKLLHHWLHDLTSYVSNETGHLVQVRDKLVSQCPEVPEAMQRPVWYEESTYNESSFTRPLTSLFLNVAEGAHDPSKRFKFKQWLTEQAESGVSFIGLSEMNDWDKLENPTEYKYNFPRMRRLASEVGFSYYHVMSSSQPYNIGIMSAVPFEVVAEYYPPLFQRGLLHVFMRSIRLHVFVAHMHAHSSHQRELEMKELASLVHPIIEQNNMKVIVMGDLNTLYDGDKESHSLWTDLFEDAAISSPVVRRLKKKFCHEHSPNINYNPMTILMNVGLRDSCSEHCSQTSSDDGYRQCYEDYCSYSQPTEYNPEVRKQFRNETVTTLKAII